MKNLEPALFENVMKQGMDSWANYSGPDWSGWYCGPSESRDAEIMEISNFQAALDMLGGEVKGQVEIREVSHWACGWYKQIMVHKDAPQVSKLEEIRASLENYPLLDEDDFSERENKYHAEYAEQVQDELAEALTLHFAIPKRFKKQVTDVAYQLNMECQRYYGNDSCVDVYSMREPEFKDIKQLETCLDQICFQDDSIEQAIKEYLLAVVGVQTPDGVAWNDSGLDFEALNEMIGEL